MLSTVIFTSLLISSPFPHDILSSLPRACMHHVRDVPHASPFPSFFHMIHLFTLLHPLFSASLFQVQESRPIFTACMQHRRPLALPSQPEWEHAGNARDRAWPWAVGICNAPSICLSPLPFLPHPSPSPSPCSPPLSPSQLVIAWMSGGSDTLANAPIATTYVGVIEGPAVLHGVPLALLL